MRYCCETVLLLDFHCDRDRLRVDTELTLLHDISFQHHNCVVAITQRSLKIHVMVIPVFIVALLSDKDENAINNRKDILFHLIKCSDQLYGSIVSKNTN